MHLRFGMALVLIALCSSCSQGSNAAGSASASASPSGSGRRHGPPGASGAPSGSARAWGSGSAHVDTGPALVIKPVALPDAAAPAFVDYFADEPGTSRVWVPVPVTGSVDVYDTKAGTFTRVDGFTKDEHVLDGKKRTSGPSSVGFGDGFAYVGNRASNEVCAVDTKALKLGACLKLAAQPDGLVYISDVKEVWVTTPRDKSITVLDASTPATLKAKTVIKLEGESEGLAVDTKRGIFYSNLEDKGSTLAFDIKTHKVTATWNPDCGENGPRGLAVDIAKGFVFVSCTDHVQALDAQHNGAYLGKVDTGAGTDNIDYREDKGLLYAAAGKAGKVTVAHVDDKGLFSVVASAPTAPGARSVVVDEGGAAYVADTTGARLLVISPLP